MQHKTDCRYQAITLRTCVVMAIYRQLEEGDFPCTVSELRSRDARSHLDEEFEKECLILGVSAYSASSTRFVRTRSPACAPFSVVKNFLVKFCCRWKSCAACDL